MYRVTTWYEYYRDLRFGTWMGHLEIVKEPFTQCLLESSNGKVLNQFGISIECKILHSSYVEGIICIFFSPKVTICNHQADSPLYVWGLMSDLVICKFRKSVVIRDTKYMTLNVLTEIRCH